MLDCGAPGRLISRICGAVGRGGGAGNALAPFGHGGGVQLPNRDSISGWTLGKRPVGDDEDLRIVGPQPALLERQQVGAAELGDCRRIAAARAAVRMVGAVEHRRQQPPGDARRVLLRLRDCGQRLRLESRSMSSGPERRVLHHVAHQVERRREVRRKRVQRHVRAVGPVAAVDVAAEPFLGLGYLLRA